jgi:hypothetical protein
MPLSHTINLIPQIHMKTPVLLGAFALLTTSLSAGPMYAPSNPMAPMESSQTLFGPGFHLGGHGLFLTPDADIEETWGGGINADYFISPFIGFQGSASWADPGTSEIWHNYTVDLVARIPIEAAYIAPYAFVGGGAIVEDEANVLGRAGVGLEFRPTASFGLFADWLYAFPGGGGGEGDVEDYQMIRMGVKFGF